MVDILMTRAGNILRPYDQMAEEDLCKLSDAKPLMVSVRSPRSLPHHRLYFQCLREMVRSGAPGTSDDLHNATKIKAGLVSICQLPSGEYMAFPDSIAFNKLDQSGFNVFFAKAVAFWRSSGLWQWLPHDLQAKLSDNLHDHSEAA